MTAQELIASSLRLCGAIAGGEVPTADEFEDALAVLRDILEGWTVEGLTPHATLDQTFELTPQVATYTIGPLATWDGYRPIRIRAVTIDGCPVPLTRIQYNATYPVATVMIDPCLVEQGGSITLTSELAFVLPDESVDELLLPPGYIGAIRHALAVMLAPEYGLDVMPAVGQAAVKLKADLKRANIKHTAMRAPIELQGRSWLADIGFGGPAVSGGGSGDMLIDGGEVFIP